MALGIVLFSVCASSTAFAADKIVIRLGNGEPNVGMWETPNPTVLTTVFKNQVERNSNGRITVEAFHSGQLGDYASMLGQVQRNLLTAAVISSGLYATYYPDIQALDIPYLFRSPEQANDLLVMKEGSYAKELSDKMAAKTNIRILTFLVGAMRDFSNSKREIKTPDDMKGLRIRVMQIPAHIKTVEALGAAATPISYSELYTALQTGVVDGQENAPFVLNTIRLHEVQKYVTLDGHFANINSLCISEKFMQSLSPEDRKIVWNAAYTAMRAYTGTQFAKEEVDLEAIAAKMKITALTEEQFLQFRAKAQPPVIEYLKGTINPAEVDRIINAVKAMEGQ
ncbi:ABC transporter substrate-binding protein [Deltaproteobacteria bacterium]|nr:ABC transporter substrate-binding protein [Deltaproteobacteria bacterium]